jgi:hypothetical protein
MNTKNARIHENEVIEIIRKFREWLGESNVLKGILKIEKTQGELYRRFYSGPQHPFWEGFRQFDIAEKRGFQGEIPFDSFFLLAAYAQQILALVSQMPEKLAHKYHRDLCDDERAGDYLFELDVAWHLSLQGYQIYWSEDTGVPRTEFQAEKAGMVFDIECKRVTPDAKQPLKRADVLRLADYIRPKIQKLGLGGRVEICLTKAIPRGNQELISLSNDVLQAIKKGESQDLEWGAVSVDVFRGQLIVPRSFVENRHKIHAEEHPYSHLIEWGTNVKEGVQDYFELLISSKVNSQFLDHVKQRTIEACNQLGKAMPGIVAIHIPTRIEELVLRNIVDSVLQKPTVAHVAAFVYLRNKEFEETLTGYRCESPANTFYSLVCSYRTPPHFLDH